MNSSFKKIVFLFSALSFLSGVSAQNLLLKAKGGSPEAQYELATQYYKGIGQLQNYNSAFAWYKKAAEKNHLASCYALAQMYEKGLGCSKNERLAFSYYLQAAERGHFDSQLRVAQMFDEGIGVIDNPARAYLWYRICAERGEPYSCRRIGDYYMYGEVVNKDLIEAKYWYTKAADQKDLDAMQKLAYIYILGESVAPNYTKASELCQEPLEKNMPMAQYVKAYLMENGYGEKKRQHKALELYRKSALQGFEPAKEPVALARYYNDKQIDSLLNLKTLTKVESRYILGKEYVQGKLTKRNLKKGLEYLNEAASAGSADANLELGKLYKDGKIVRKNSRKANNYFKNAVIFGSKEAEQYVKK